MQTQCLEWIIWNSCIRLSYVFLILRSVDSVASFDIFVCLCCGREGFASVWTARCLCHSVWISYFVFRVGLLHTQLYIWLYALCTRQTYETIRVWDTVKVKVKCSLVQALRLCTDRTACRGSRGIALPFHDHGTRRGWGVSVTPRPLFIHRERPGTHCTGGWVGPRASLDRCGKLYTVLHFLRCTFYNVIFNN